MVITVLISGCGWNHRLTRNGAKEILDKVAAQSSFTQIVLNREQAMSIATKRASEGDIRTSKACLPDASDVRVLFGQFVFCSALIPPGVTSQQPGLLVTFNKPYRWSLVEVTGMSDGQAPNEKNVEYTWEYVFPDFSQDLQSALKYTPRPGKALLRLYDDGWRFVSFE